MRVSFLLLLEKIIVVVVGLDELVSHFQVGQSGQIGESVVDLQVLFSGISGVCQLSFTGSLKTTRILLPPSSAKPLVQPIPAVVRSTTKFGEQAAEGL